MDRPLVFRATALWTASIGAMSLAAACGFWESGTDWVLAWGLVAGLYLVAAGGLWAGRPFARPFARGLAIFGTGAFLQAFFALGYLPSIAVGFVAHAALLAATFALPTTLSARQSLSVTLASAALVPAAAYAFAPEQSGSVAIAVASATAFVWVGAFGVARGRTWGLLLALVGAPILATTVFFAPSLSFFVAPHFLVTQPLQPLMLDVLGSVAALSAILAVLPFVGPMFRFLRVVR
ncbi:MAG: hypothetical protein JRH11_17075 [Deltaproteobacteria bacterium]|nr:hypothetical protein [Deltaproteobacteria bacterium]